MNRRNFLSNLVMFSGGALIDPSTVEQVEGFSLKFGLSILQGFTDETTTQFTVDVPKMLKTHYEVFDPQTGRRFYPKAVTSMTRDLTLYRVDKILFNDLYLGKGFQLLIKDKKNKIIDQRSFKTLDTSLRNARVAMISCQFDLSPFMPEMWKLVYATNPDVLFFTGDNVYGDILGQTWGPDLLWFRYITSRRKIHAYKKNKLIPTIATWDDHDYGKDNANGDYEHKKNSTATFEAFFPQVPQSDKFSRGPGISSSFAAFGRKFIFLDGRSFRRLPTEKYDVGFIGDEQMQWFREQCTNFDGPVMVITGSQFFGGYDRTNDCYENASPEEFNELLSVLAGRNQPCIFGSGDVHFSEVMKLEHHFLGQSAFEITSSCLHSVPNMMPIKNRRRLDAALLENFVIIDFTENLGQQFVQGLGRGRKKHFNLKLDVA